MKVSELIAILATMPMDAPVMHLWDGQLRTEIQFVWLARSGEVATSDYSMVCYATDERPVEAPTAEQAPYWETISDPGDEDE